MKPGWGVRMQPPNARFVSAIEKDVGGWSRARSCVPSTRKGDTCSQEPDYPPPYTSTSLPTPIIFLSIIRQPSPSPLPTIESAWRIADLVFTHRPYGPKIHHYHIVFFFIIISRKQKGSVPFPQFLHMYFERHAFFPSNMNSATEPFSKLYRGWKEKKKILFHL